MKVTSPNTVTSAVDPSFKQLKFLSEDEVSAIRDELIHQMEVHSSESLESSENSPAMRTNDNGHKALDILLSKEDTPTDSVTLRGLCRKMYSLVYGERRMSIAFQG